jgi:membrane protease YdiL (CAAX protease family)
VTESREVRSAALLDALVVALAALLAPFALRAIPLGALPAAYRLSASVVLLGILLGGVAFARARPSASTSNFAGSGDAGDGGPTSARARRTGEGRLAAFGLTSDRPLLAEVVLGVGIAGCILAANALLLLLFSKLQPQAFAQASEARESSIEALAAVPLPLALGTSLFAGVYEELVFRGFLLGRLRVALPGKTAIVVIGQAFVFAVGHGWQGPIGVVQSFVVGLLFGALAAWGGVRVGIAAHATIDAASFVLLHTLR